MSYLQTLKADAIKVWHSHQVLPSICAAQASLESGWGTSRLAKEFNNHFGIKASADWTGRKVTMLTGEHVNGGRIEIYADFRAYDTIYDSIADYAAFFTNTPWRTENYKHVVGETDYKKAANALRAAGYATDPQYPTKLIKIIEDNNLQAWDREALASAGGSSPTNQTTASQYDASKANGATVVSTNGWNLTEVNQFLMNSVDPPYINGAYINKFLSTYYSDSPLIGQGDTIKEMSDYYGISVGAAMGVWAKETTFGRGHPGKVDHNYGCIKWTSGSGYPSVTYDGIQWNKYPSKKVGIAAWFSLVRNNYVELGYHRYSNFLDRYSPTGDSNVHATFKNLMWGVLKSFGYNMTNTATKFNHSKPSDNPSTVNPPKTGITQPSAGGGGVSQSKPVNKLVGGQLTSAAEKFARENGASWIGDSLMVGTEPHAKKMSPGSNFDGLGSRQITHATPSLNATTVLKNMINAGILKSIIIFVIGTNRGVTRAEIDAVMTLIGSERKIIFVSTASEVNHSAGVAGEYRGASDRYQNAFYADWHQEGRAKREVYYTPDGAGGKRIHMTSEGYKAHADYLTAAWYEVATADYTQDVAVAAPVVHYDIEDFELNVDGIITYYENTKPVTGADGKVTFIAEKKTHDTGIKGFFSPKGDKYVYYPESNNRWSHGGEAGTPTWIDTIYTNDKTSSAIELIEGAIQDLIEKSEPASQYTISLLDVNKDLSIGDYGVFIDHKYNPPLYIEARILSISTSLTDQTANTVVIGNVIELVQKENPDITALKAELQNNRSEIKKEMQSQNPITATLLSSNGYILGDAHKETQLILKLFQGTKDVTDQYNTFEWERTSSDSVSDEQFNKLLEVEKSNTIKVYNRDIMNNQSVFIGRAYSNSGGLMKQAELKLSFSDTAIWSGSDSEPTDAVDGSTWTKPDGTQWVLVDGVWEEKVNQAVISQVRVEVEGAMAEAEQAKQDAITAYDEAVAEAKRSADEADALIRAEIEQEIEAVETELSIAKQEAIDASNQALDDAKAHAIAQDTLIKDQITAEIEAIDEEFTLAKQEATDRANQALADAKAHADAQDNLIKDQIVTEVGAIGEEMEQAKQDAIAATNQALTDAKAHAIAQDAALKIILQGEIGEVEAEAEQAKQDAQNAYTDAVAEAEAKVQAKDEEYKIIFGGYDTAIEAIEEDTQTAKTKAEQALADVGISNDLAQTAKDLATTAQSNASTAKTDASKAKADASTAVTNANQAKADASTAVTNANQAKADASKAKTDAQTAITEAGQAIASSNTAKTNAQTAIDDAQSALTEAGNAKTTADTLSIKVSDLEGEVELKASQTEVDGISGTVSTHTTTIGQQATAIASKADKTVVDTLSGTVSNQGTLISQNATAITNKASSTSVNTLTGRVDTAESNITQNATDITQRVTTTTYNSGIASKENTVLKQSTAPTHVNGRLWLDTSATPNILKRSTGSAWVKATPTTAGEVGAYSQSDGAGLAGRLTTAETSITQTATDITQKADKSTVDTLSGTVSTQGTTITQNATAIASKANQTEVDTVKGTVSGHTTTISQHATAIASKAESSLVNTIKGTVDTHTTDIRQNATDISSKANTATVNTLTGRVSTAESNISQNATAITQRVTTTTYNTGIGSKEDSVLKQTTAPTHLSGRLWLDTSVTPNVLKRSTGSAWVKATPTTASEVGAYSSSQGSTLAGRVTTAETNITQTSTAITSKADKSVVDTLSGTVSTHNTTISQHATAIASKASQTEVDIVKGTVSTHTSTLSQQANEISARLTESQVNILVGGKGYATQTWSNQTFATPQSVTTQLQSYAKTTALNGMVTETTLATKQFVTAGSMSTTLSNYAQKSTVPTNTQFNTLKNSYDSMEQTIGTNGSKIAQMVMTDSVFKTTVAKQSDVSKNYRVYAITYSNRLADWAKWSSSRIIRPDGSIAPHNSNHSDRSYFLYVINENGEQVHSKVYDVYSSTDQATALANDIKSFTNRQYLIILMGSHAPAGNRTEGGLPQAIYQIGGSPEIFINEDWSNQPAYLLVGKPGLGQGRGYEYFVPASQGGSFDITIPVLNGSSPLIDSSIQAVNSQVTQLADSWALTLKSGNDIKTQINASTDSIRLQSKLIHLSGTSLIDDAIIKSAHIDSLNANKITGNTADFNTIRTGVLTADAVTATHIKSENALIDNIFANQALVDRLWAKTIWTNKITTMSLDAARITSGTINAARLNASAIVTDGLTANVIKSTHIQSSTLLVDKIFANQAMVDHLWSKAIWTTKLTALEIDAGQINAGTIATARLNATDIVTSGLTANVIKSTHIQADELLVDKVFANQASIDRLWAKTIWANKITTMSLSASQIKAGTIDAARLNASAIVTAGLSADVVTSTHIKADTALIDSIFATQVLVDRLWAKTIWANKITAISLNASQITAGTINAARLNSTAIVTAGLTANVVTSTHIKADDALIDNIFATTALIEKLTSKTAFINNIKAINISADKIQGGSITGSTFSTTASADNFTIELKNGNMEFKRAIFTMGTMNLTKDATTLQPNGFAITQRPGFMFNIASTYNDGSTTSSPVIQIPVNSDGASKKLNIYAQGGLYIDSDSFDLSSTVASFNVPLASIKGLRASHAYNSTVINNAGNLMYSVDKESSGAMFHRLSVVTKSGTWVNSRFEFYEDGRLARVVNGVRTFF